MPVRNSAKALVLHEGKILVNRCTSRFGDYYALPGGGQREGETLLEAVRRELLEETGAVGHSYYPLGQLYPSPGYCAEIIHLYFCRVESVEQPSPDEDEFLSIEKIPLEKAVEMVLQNQIPDAKTQTAVLKTALLLKRGTV